MNVQGAREGTQPAQRRRGLGMIRVSKERDGMTSPDIQRNAIESFAATNAIDIVDWVEGIDESGSRVRSAWWPRLDQSVERLKRGEIDVIVVWKFSRTGRNRLKWAIAIDSVDTAGGAILSATEPIETATASGRFARGMLGELNAYQADLIGEGWKDSHARRFREGKPINGRPRFGYVYDTASKSFAPDPVSGPILAAAYRRYIAGESFYSLIEWLNRGPTRPVAGYGPRGGDGLWTQETLRRVLDAGFGAGVITYRGETKTGAHEPVITTDEWEAYLETRNRRRVYRRTERSEYTYSGILWCTCGSKMHGSTSGGDPSRAYRCRYGIEKRAHAGGYILEKQIDKAVLAWLGESRDRAHSEIAESISRLPEVAPVDATAELERRLAELANKQVVLAEQRLIMGLPQASYETLRDRWAAEAAGLEQELRTTKKRRVAPLTVLPVLLDRWDDLEVAERREYIRSLVARIEITPGTRASQRIAITPH